MSTSLADEVKHLNKLLSLALDLIQVKNDHIKNLTEAFNLASEVALRTPPVPK